MKNLLKTIPNARPLTDHERRGHLPQKSPAPIPLAWPQMSVIRMNSTFLECVELGFRRKGFFSAGMLTLLIIVSTMFISLVPLFFEKWATVPEHKFIQMILAFTFCILLALLLMAASFYALSRESFSYTNYPMRFNRITRMVHVFIQYGKGRILSMPWDDVFFTTATKGTDAEFIVMGHRLDEDKKTVLDTFALMHIDDFDSEYRFFQWEFIRQYMEGDETNLARLAGMVDEINDIAERRESIYESFRRAMSGFAGTNPILALITLPLILFATLGRQFVMYTSKKPIWPTEIEATCQYSPNDPILRDRNHLARRGDVPPPDIGPYVGK
jgi:hypothetical protein